MSHGDGLFDTQEVDALKETTAQLVAHNERLEKELGNSRQEAAQRDKVLEEMENVLHVRDDIIHALRGASGSRVTAGPPRTRVSGRSVVRREGCCGGM